jgi:uncharacterized cupin superfamily protein
MSITDITVLQPQGPGNSGLATLPPIPKESLVSGEPVQSGVRYHEDPKSQLRIGVWACTPFKTVMEPHAVHEFMHVLEGSVTIVHEDGSELIVKAGERFFIPKGTVRSWQQTEAVRKYYMIFPDPSGATAEDPKALRAFKIEIGAEQKAGSAGGISIYSIYRDPTSQYSIGIWNPDVKGRGKKPMPAAEILLPVDGSVTFVGENGQHSVAPGEAAVVPAGVPFGWSIEKPASVIYCAFKSN